MFTFFQPLRSLFSKHKAQCLYFLVSGAEQCKNAPWVPEMLIPLRILFYRDLINNVKCKDNLLRSVPEDPDDNLLRSVPKHHFQCPTRVFSEVLAKY